LFGYDDFGAKVVCEAKDFRSDHLPEAYQKMDRYIQFALSAGQQAVEDAGLEKKHLSDAGVVLATAICGTQTLDREFVKVTSMGQTAIRPEEVDPNLYAAAMGNAAALALAEHYHTGGECITLSTGCIAGVDAISYAFDSIAYGDHDVILAGATEAPVTPITIAAFDIINCLSHYQNYPTQASRPFCTSRDGFVLSEGCGIVVLEELEHALARHATIYAELTGWAVAEHAEHMTDMSTNGHDLARTMVGALESSRIAAGDVDYVNAHGTSTPQNDIRETQAIRAALGDRAYEIPVNSTKSMLGHALAAASAMEVVACAISLQTQQIHPTINYTDPDPACDLDYVPRSRQCEMEYLLTNASGFSGLHAVLAMKRYQLDGEGAN
ncbi:MAG TPA: beta-ketoacyl-[acyl-carrier-protein] synthase family protein, partial [Ktedonobacteraceae bacterium]|nr:beta-ketoacyl-[acyl-carrier-protein] synthase family protein [Ktedonobacteraceae bacterium]